MSINQVIKELVYRLLTLPVAKQPDRWDRGKILGWNFQEAALLDDIEYGFYSNILVQA